MLGSDAVPREGRVDRPLETFFADLEDARVDEGRFTLDEVTAIIRKDRYASH